MFSRKRKQQPKSDRVVIRGLVMPKGTKVKLGSVLPKSYISAKQDFRTKPSQVGNRNG